MIQQGDDHEISWRAPPPWTSAPMALAAGIGFALFLGNLWGGSTSRWSRRLMQLSVTGLGFGMSLPPVWKTGRGAETVAKQSLVVRLILVGLGLTREVLWRNGPRPLVQEVLLWLAVAEKLYRKDLSHRTFDIVITLVYITGDQMGARGVPVTALPWLIYSLTQALIHPWVVRRFARHLAPTS